MLELLCKYNDKYYLRDSQTAKCVLLTHLECQNIKSEYRDFKVTKNGLVKKNGHLLKLTTGLNFYKGDCADLCIPYIHTISGRMIGGLDFSSRNLQSLLWDLEKLKVKQLNPLLLESSTGFIALDKTSTGLRVILTALEFLQKSELICLDITECYGAYRKTLYEICYNVPIILYDKRGIPKHLGMFACNEVI